MTAPDNTPATPGSGSGVPRAVVRGTPAAPTDPAESIESVPAPPMVTSVPVNGLVTAPVPRLRVSVLLLSNVRPPLKISGLAAPRKVRE